jgi:vancomycin resistance protein VanW
MRSIKRSALRIILGKIVYRMKRYFEWYFGRTTFAKEYNHSKLPYSVFKHRTPLFGS